MAQSMELTITQCIPKLVVLEIGTILESTRNQSTKARKRKE